MGYSAGQDAEYRALAKRYIAREITEKEWQEHLKDKDLRRWLDAVGWEDLNVRVRI